jgi:hypothetical protein
MALVPKINICIQSKCDKIDVYEETGPYDATNNPEGWANSGSVTGHVDTSEISNAQVRIYDALQTQVLDVIVLKDNVTDVFSGVVGAPAPATFLAVKDHVWEQPDGAYFVEYIVSANIPELVVYPNDTQHVLFICNLENCLNGLKAKAAGECDAEKLSNLKDKIDQLEVLIYGIKSAFSCADFTTVADLIETGTTICENLCDCGCGDC